MQCVYLKQARIRISHRKLITSSRKCRNDSQLEKYVELTEAENQVCWFHMNPAGLAWRWHSTWGCYHSLEITLTWESLAAILNYVHKRGHNESFSYSICCAVMSQTPMIWASASFVVDNAKMTICEVLIVKCKKACNHLISPWSLPFLHSWLNLMKINAIKTLYERDSSIMLTYSNSLMSLEWES